MQKQARPSLVSFPISRRVVSAEKNSLRAPLRKHLSAHFPFNAHLPSSALDILGGSLILKTSISVYSSSSCAAISSKFLSAAGGTRRVALSHFNFRLLTLTLRIRILFLAASLNLSLCSKFFLSFH